MMSDDEIKLLVASNAKAIQALTHSIAELKQEWQKDRDQWEKDRDQWEKNRDQWEKDREQWQNERTQFYDTMREMQREFLDLQRRVSDQGADIRELTIENQRILRYLENLVNRPQKLD